MLFVLYSIQKWFVTARSVSEIRHVSCTSALLTEKVWHTSIQQIAQNKR